MSITIRRAEAADAAACGDILYRAFQTRADYHNFPRPYPSAEVAIGVLSTVLANPGFYGIVAEQDGRVVGSNFADQRSRIAGIGPITVDPEVESRGIGRSLIREMLDHLAAQSFAGIRLVAAAYNNRALCLYTTLGFQARVPRSVLQGPAVAESLPGYEVRPAVEGEIAACNAMCHRVHGFGRGVELREAIAAQTARIVKHLGRITGYATGVAFAAHAVAETNQDLKALIGAAPAFPGPGFLLPTRNREVFAWCLDNDLRLVMQMQLMTIGLYNEPAGAWLPSILM
jgi:ribosomal protein S18 acetylase RimI-like enzyme